MRVNGRLNLWMEEPPTVPLAYERERQVRHREACDGLGGRVPDCGLPANEANCVLRSKADRGAQAKSNTPSI